MTDATKTQTDAFQALLSSAGPMGQIGALWAETMTEMGSEVLGFLSERLHEDVEIQKKIMECTDMEQLSHVQAEFVQKAIDQYTAETGKLVEIGAGAMRKAGFDPDL